MAHAGKILALCQTQHGDRNLIVTGGNDNSVAVWDVKDSESSSVAEAARSDGK